MVGAALNGDFAEEIQLQCLKRGIVVNKVTPDTLRFLPPLTITQEEIDRLLEVLGEVIEKGFTHSG
jgi:4-aminobutyrate aminotransferase-like enzyme